MRADLRAKAGILQDREKRIYYGVVTDPASVPWPQNRVWWYCSHDHRSVAEAEQCAQHGLRILRRRERRAALRAAGPEA
jgi:hypothetical protein